MSETILHGYTVSELHRLATVAAHAPAANWMDAGDVYDAAWHAIVEALLLADVQPEPSHLVITGRQAAFQAIRDEQRHRGIPRDDPWAGQGAKPSFARYWWSSQTQPDHAPSIVDRQALVDIWPTLSASQRAALTALAVTDDYQDAAALLGVTRATFKARIATGRRVFQRWWHQFETPARQYRVDRRRGMLLRHGTSKHGPRRDTCIRGHPWNEANTRLTRDGGRECRACERERRQVRRAGRPQEAAA
jgi:DNA-directed RNA polymerase specialized sigma24 family protein